MLNKASQKRVNQAVNGHQVFREAKPAPEAKAPVSAYPVRRKRYFSPSWMY